MAVRHTRDQLLLLLQQAQDRIALLTKENRAIEQELSELITERKEIKDSVADEIAEEIDFMSDVINKYQCYGTVEEIAAERKAFLEALGMDDFEWERMRWRYE
mgnify:CR=1 FL=1